MSFVVSAAGPPGAGKTTLCARLAKKEFLDGLHGSCGSLLHALGDPKLETILARGDLAPEHYVERVIERLFEEANGKPVMLEGVPRHAGHPAMLAKILARWGYTWLVHFNLYCPHQTALARVHARATENGKRMDDDAFEKRYGIYQKSLPGLNAMIKGEGLPDLAVPRPAFHKLDGRNYPDMVANEAMKIIHELRRAA
ncbi:MAG: hypothetical protein COY40_02790 [Alphaproteobacteria bacterium CG_4_10_14_0_8_um_filter_53_9]|nr:MAG: hypothetical protein COY40_02790 [Alphaproteobacteria bacterium CG_4_10_14_0_8_um_filter_53_9]